MVVNTKSSGSVIFTGSLSLIVILQVFSPGNIMPVNDMVGLVAFLGCLAVVQAYAGGPPLFVCKSMTPEKFSHGDAQTTASPYTVTTSKSTYMPDETITMTLSSRDNSPFKGVFVQARLKSGPSTNPQGTFVLNNGESQLRLMNCDNIANSAVSHNSGDPKTNKTIRWKAPSASVGDIHFMVTFVKERTTFWEGVMSADVRASADITTTTTTTTTMRPTTTTTTMKPTIITSATTATTALLKRPETTTTKTTSANRQTTTSIRMLTGGSNALVLQGMIVWSSIAVTRLLHMMF